MSEGNPSIYERWRRKFGFITGLGLTDDEAKERDQAYKHQKCVEWKRDLLATSGVQKVRVSLSNTATLSLGPKIIFMLQHLRELGSNVPSSSTHCVPCSNSAGTAHPPSGHIFLCQGTHLNRKHMEDSITHELIHLYDHARFKVNWNDLRHHACSEIRANNLSGDCSYGREVQRGFFAFTKHHQECVRRRAIVSVRMHPGCPDDATAERVVNEVFESCVEDTRPFDEIY